MRTITEKLSNRLKVQAREAEIQGLKKMASHLDRLSQNETRGTASAYVYPESDLVSDVEGPLWDAVIRIADYYDCNLDAEFMQDKIEKLAQDLVKAVSKQSDIRHGVGAFEPIVPGEVVEQVLIEVE